MPWGGTVFKVSAKLLLCPHNVHMKQNAASCPKLCVHLAHVMVLKILCSRYVLAKRYFCISASCQGNWLCQAWKRSRARFAG